MRESEKFLEANKFRHHPAGPDLTEVSTARYVANLAFNEGYNKAKADILAELKSFSYPFSTLAAIDAIKKLPDPAN